MAAYHQNPTQAAEFYQDLSNNPEKKDLVSEPFFDYELILNNSKKI